MEERKRGLDNDDDSGVNTVRSSGQSATKAPEEKSHLSLLRLFSRPLVPLFQRGLSLHHTRGRRHTVVCVRARVHLRHARRYPSIPRPLPIPLTRAGHPLLSLSFMSIENTAFSIGTSARVPRGQLQQNHLQMHTWARAIARVGTPDSRQRDGGVGVRIGRREVGDGTRDTSLGREREGQREWGTHGLPSFLRAPPFMGHPLFPPRRTSCSFSLFLLHSLRPQPLICESCASSSPSITHDTGFIRVRRVSFDLRKDSTLASLSFEMHVYVRNLSICLAIHKHGYADFADLTT